MLIVLVYLCCPIICLTFCIPCYDVCYGFHMDTMFGSSLPSALCRRDHVMFTLFVFACMWWCPARVVLPLCFVFLCLVYPVDYFSPSVFSDVYVFIFWLLTVNQIHNGNFVCLQIEDKQSYIEKALLHLTGQMDDIFIHVHPYH